MTNPHRSEVAVDLGGERLVLRLTLQALAEIEAAIAPDGLAALAERFASGQFVLREIVAMLGAMARGGGQSISDQALAERLDAGELPRLLLVLARVFGTVLGGDNLPGEPERLRPAETPGQPCPGTPS